MQVHPRLDVQPQVKEVEKTTNHDVKAIEYVLKDLFMQNAELAKVRAKLGDEK